MKARLFVPRSPSERPHSPPPWLLHIGHGTIRAPGSEYGEEHEATQTIGGATCGVERWPVKTLADANKAQVRFVVHPGDGALSRLAQVLPQRGHALRPPSGVGPPVSKMAMMPLPRGP
jgi:hypothetical protein